ncbi:MAG: hypothetical protein ACI9DG_002589 [Oleispira sp.]|jgi:hypothetical protein
MMRKDSPNIRRRRIENSKRPNLGLIVPNLGLIVPRLGLLLNELNKMKTSIGDALGGYGAWGY